MSQPTAPVAATAAPVPAGHDDAPPHDAVEAAVPYIPVVIPAVGAIMIFLLAMIAVYMA